MARMNQKTLLALLETRSTEIIDAKNLRARIAMGRRLRVKLGIDPTTPNLHLGHVVPLRMLRAFQDAGHEAVLIIGDFTGQIGDPSGESRARRQMTRAETRANERTYRAQAAKILDLKRTEFRHNSEWHGGMRLREFLDLLAHFPLKAAWEREDFQSRLASGKAVYLHEAMYPVLQAYDSVAVRADVELGGVDQRLNLLAGRELQRALGQPAQDIVLLPYLVGPDGVEKMSKSVGNTINLTDSALEMVGRTMSIPDRLIGDYARLAAWMSPDQTRVLERRLVRRENPRDVKLDVAEAIAALYHGRAKAAKAREDFLRMYSKKEFTRAPLAKLRPGGYQPIELVMRLGAASSRSQARRLVLSRAVDVDGAVIDGKNPVRIRRGSVVRIGKRNFFRVR